MQNLIFFIIVAHAQTSMRQCLRDYIFVPHSYVLP